MIKLKVLIPLLASFALMACQGQKTEVIREYVGNSGRESNYDGGTDSGGGNGVDGHSIEEYAVNIQEDASYQQYVLPIILKIAETHPRFASDMVHITSERTWYKIPVSLNSLKATQIGVSFGDKDLQQFALQNLKAVWINSRHFDRFETDETRARLILHEILMGVRLMKLKNSLDNCYSGAALLKLNPAKADEYKKEREACAIKYVFSSTDPILIPGVGSGLDLSNDDYDNIRGLGVNLWNEKGVISKIELDAWLKANKFRSY
ncbi:hypothetical protein [Bdellovibrio svalbardensis]|uniref:Lipoprotein n=1 Tax=Bdellovibrio svalbardensis TaxID=2972972 RepID=A0ABT6DKT7_9BACT|nr:hypothetical protein [Bdellovibrio svalbardensis]MDG0817127.1 hypothetical protein [Bdellovibrio svalbardensis]